MIWRRRAAAVVFVASLVAVCASATRQTAAAPPARPNIVVILSDDQRWDTLWGMPTVEEALAENGVTFANSFVVNPLCCSSRASLLTGRYAHSTGVYLNRPPHGGFTSFDDRHTLATVLHGAGYETGLFGKYLNDYGSRSGEAGYVPPGWDRWSVFFGGTRYYDYRLTENRRVLGYGHRPSDYSTAVLARKAVQFVRNAHGPFFLLFAPFAPHEPATPPPGYEDAFSHFSWWKPPSFNESDLSDKPAYIRRVGSLTPRQVSRAERFRREQLEAALAVDDGVRSLLKALAQRGLLDTTFIAYTSDNGVAWGEHPLIAARKLVPYEEPIRVPLVVRYDPLVHEQPAQDGHLVLNIDLAPTLAAVAGTRMTGTEGRNLLPLLTSHRPVPWRTEFLVEHLAGPPQRDVPTYCAVRTERYKYVLYQTREEELYDLARDPHELHNIASHPAMAATKTGLRLRLSRLCRPVPPGYTALDRAPAATASTVSIFAPRGAVTDCARVAPLARTVGGPRVLEGAMRALLAGPTRRERARGYGGWFSAATAGHLRSARIAGGVAYVDFRSFAAHIPNASTSCGSTLLLAQLDRTAEQFPSVRRTVYSFNGSRTAFYEWLQREAPKR